MQSRGDPPSRSLRMGPPGTPTAGRKSRAQWCRDFHGQAIPTLLCSDRWQTQQAAKAPVAVVFSALSPPTRHLQIYLGWHHFCIGSSNFHASIKARSVVGLHNVSAVGFVCPYTAVVWTCNSTDEKQEERELPEGKRAQIQGRTRLSICFAHIASRAEQ